MSDTFADPGQRYRLDELIATGGMGEVWKATDVTLGRTVAVKVLRSEYADDEGFRRRFESEARNAASLHHSGIAQVFDYGDATQSSGPNGVRHRPWIVMEYVDGKPLSDLLRAGVPMPAAEATGLATQVADALAAAHRAGVVHRDIKPANLMITPDRRVKVTDFGIARAADGVEFTQTGQVMGTPQYLSPEQASGGRATPASDVYSLGVVLYECLAGRRPFVRESAVATALAHVREEIPPLADAVPAEVAAVTMRALAKDPAQRYADGAAFAAALRDPASAAAEAGVASAGAPVAPVVAAAPVSAAGAAASAGPAATAILPAAGAPAAVPPGPPDSGDPKKSSRAWWWVLAALVLAAIVAFAVIAATGGSDDSPSDDPTSQATPTGEPTDQATTPPPDEPTDEPTTEAPPTTEEPPTEETPTVEPTTPTTPEAPTSDIPTETPPTNDTGGEPSE